MKSIIAKLTISVVLIIVIAGCNDSNSTTPTSDTNQNTSSVKVHSTGYITNSNDIKVAMYWNGEITTPLTDGSQNASGVDIEVSGSDVYIFGYEGNKQVLWKNGTKTILDSSVIIRALKVVANDIYFVGSTADTKNPSKAVYIKNGITTQLDNTDYTTANCIVVSGSDVYIGGSQSNGAVYWKNGVKTTLVPPSTDPNLPHMYSVSDITLMGNSVICAGNSTYELMYWKNNVPTEVQHFHDYPNPVEAKVAVNNSDVYMTGIPLRPTPPYKKAFYTKNKEVMTLSVPDNAKISYSKTLALKGDTLVVAGSYDGKACFWKNNVMTLLPIQASTNTAVNDVFLTN